MTKFTNDQKLETITRYQNSSESIGEIAKSIGTYCSVVSNWIKQFEYHGLSAFEKSYTTYTTQFKMDVRTLSGNSKEEQLQLNLSIISHILFMGV
ncbi:transposase [Lysinibacillus pakistanensis]|uniref:Transposase n=1 Tax=Lysinibacillus pakistanensis TaxID=759811 RepID=A0AAX3X334_9BACI|nr:transposase [Lysinibacillus pakistanensis]MDM5232762.1 transposase [Lysinibacillus pakistanensis]WHY48263.1 transposase [Lysinibacillus pakistanensis]WHY53276.1 transposase [Lysinibacillus pakistanensis]